MNLTDVLLSTFIKAGIGFTVKREKDANGRFIYIGIAPTGVATSERGWQIAKITWDSDNDPTEEQCTSANARWDNRANEF